MTISLSDARRIVERANVKFDNEKTWLYKDGQKVYAQAEHERRMAALLAPLQEAEQTVQEATKSALAAGQKAVMVQDLPAVAHLKTEELQRMAALKSVIQDDVLSTSFADLVPTLQAVVQHGDVALKSVFSQLVTRKFDAVRKAGGNLAPADAQGITLAMDTIRIIDKALIPPEVSKAVAAAQQSMQDAGELANFARATLSEADGSRAAARQSFERAVRAF